MTGRWVLRVLLLTALSLVLGAPSVSPTPALPAAEFATILGGLEAGWGRDLLLGDADLGKIEASAMAEAIMATGTAEQQALAEVKLTAIRGLGPPSGSPPSTDRPSPFLSPEDALQLRSLVRFQLEAMDSAAELPESEAARRKFLASVGDGLDSWTPPSDGPPPSPTASARASALVVADRAYGDALEHVRLRLPLREQAQVGLAIASAARARERAPMSPEEGARLARAAFGAVGEAAYQAPHLSYLLSVETPEFEVGQVVEALVRAEGAGPSLGSARAEVQLEILDRVARERGLGGIYEVLTRRQRQELLALLDHSIDLQESTRPSEPDPRLAKRVADLQARREAIAGARSRASAQPMDSAERALFFEIEAELRAPGLDDLDRPLVSVEDVARVAQKVPVEVLDAWLERTDVQLERARAASASPSWVDHLEQRKRAIEATRARRAQIDRSFLDRVKAALANPDLLRRDVYDKVEGRLTKWSGAEASERAAFLSWRWRSDGWTPPPAGPGGKPSPEGGGGGSPPWRPEPPAGPKGAPKGVRLAGELLIPGDLLIQGAGYDASTGELLVMTGEGNAALPMGTGEWNDEEMAAQLLLGVYRSIFIDGYDTLYLSIDPLDPDAPLREVPPRLTTGRSIEDCGAQKCRNAVVTHGNIADTQVGMTLYLADVFFKRLMLSVDLDTGRRVSASRLGYISPVEEWERVVQRHQRGGVPQAQRLLDLEELRGHQSESERYCRMWFDMSDLRLSRHQEADGTTTLRFGDSPVFAHSEPMRVIDEELVPAPEGKWCPDSDESAAFINKTWTRLRHERAELAQLDYVARLVAFFTWARDLRDAGEPLGFGALDQALETGELEVVDVPKYTSGIGAELEGVQELHRDATAAVYFANGTSGLRVALIGAAVNQWDALIGDGLADTPACRELVAYGDGQSVSLGGPLVAEPFARCLASMGLDAWDLKRLADSRGWSVHRHEGDPCGTGPFTSARAELPSPSSLPRIECVRYGSSVGSTVQDPGVIMLHGGVSVGGNPSYADPKNAPDLAAMRDALDPTRLGVIGRASRRAASRDVLQQPVPGSPEWTLVGATLTGVARGPTGQILERWSLDVDSARRLEGPYGVSYIAQSRQEPRRSWPVAGSFCSHDAVQVGGRSPELLRCDIGVRRPEQPPEDWATPPGLIQPLRFGDWWVVTQFNRVEPQLPDVNASRSALELMHDGYGRWAVGDLLGAEAVLMAAMERARAAVAMDPIDPIEALFTQGGSRAGLAAQQLLHRVIRWRAELKYASGDVEGAHKWAAASAFLGDESGDALLWEFDAVDSMDHPAPSLPSGCVRGQGGDADWAESCALAGSLLALQARGHGDGEQARNAEDRARGFCRETPLTWRCERLVATAAASWVDATPDAPPACRSVGDPRERWRCVDRVRWGVDQLGADVLAETIGDASVAGSPVQLAAILRLVPDQFGEAPVHRAPGTPLNLDARHGERSPSITAAHRQGEAVATDILEAMGAIVLGNEHAYEPSACESADPDEGTWAGRGELSALVAERAEPLAGCGVNQGGECEIRVQVDESAWTLDPDDLAAAVQTSLAFHLADKELPGVAFVMPVGYDALIDVYLPRARQDEMLQGTWMPFPPVEMPQRTERMVEAMLFYGYDALLVRSSASERDQAWLSARLVDWQETIAAYATLQLSDLIVPYLTDQLNYDGWSHPMPSTDRKAFIREWFAARRPGVSADGRVSYFFDGDFVEIEIGEGGHFESSRFLVPSQDVHPEVQSAMKAGLYPVRRPECWMSARWWFANVVWQIASREGVHVDYDPSSFMFGHPRMAWYPRQYEQFGPP